MNSLANELQNSADAHEFAIDGELVMTQLWNITVSNGNGYVTYQRVWTTMYDEDQTNHATEVLTQFESVAKSHPAVLSIG